MALLLAIVIALIPLAIAPGWFFYFDVTPRVVLLLLGASAAVIGWAVAAGPAGLYRASREVRWFWLAAGGMAVSLAVSTVASVNPSLSFYGSSWRYWGLATQLATLVVAGLVLACGAGQPGRLRLMLRAVTVSGLLVAVYGIVQYCGWDPFLNARSYHAGEGVFTIVRPPSTLGHADYSANWLLFVVFASAALAVWEDDRRWRWLAWEACAAGAAGIFLSGTRAALVGLTGGAALLIFWRGFRISRRTIAVVVAAAAAGLFFYLSPAGSQMRARVHWVLEEPAGGARLLLWRDSLRMAAARWPAGFGPDTFIDNFPRYQSVDLSRAFPDFYHESPHNILLDALVSQGVPGLVLLLALACTGFAAAWSMRRAHPHPAAGALAAALAAMTISAQFTCFILPTALAYYVTIAILISLAIPSLPRLPARHRWPRVAAALCGALVWTVLGVRLWIAETELAATQRDLDAGLLTDAAGHYAEQEQWRWAGTGSPDLWYSRRLAQIAATGATPGIQREAIQEAAVAAERAPRTTEARFLAYYNLAGFFARQNDYMRTEQSLRTAIDLAPNWFKGHWLLAQVLQAESRLKEAAAEAATAVSLDGGKHPEVTATLANVRAANAPSAAEAPHK